MKNADLTKVGKCGERGFGNADRSARRRRLAVRLSRVNMLPISRFQSQ